MDLLSIEQLQRLRKQLEEETEIVKTNMNALATAQDRYTMSFDSVTKLKEGESELLIPLSSSMYVKGRTNTNGKVTVDLGTGFLAKVPMDEALGILKRKIEYIIRNRRAFQEDLQRKLLQTDSVTSVLQKRIQERTSMMENTSKARS